MLDTRTATAATAATAAAPTGERAPADLRRFWRVLLAVAAPVPMLFQAAYNLLSPVDGETTFTERVAAYEANADRLDLLAWLQVPFLMLLIPAVVAVVWVTRRRTPRLTTAGALVTLTGLLAGFGILGGPVGAAQLVVQNDLDATSLAQLEEAAGAYPTELLGGTLFILAITVGLLLLGLALWRSRVVPAWMGIALALGGFTHPFLPGHVAVGLGLVVAAVGFAGASVALLKTSDDDFDLPPVGVLERR